MTALASANVSRLIDDAYLRLELEAIAGRAGPITHMQDDTIQIKPAAAVKLVLLDITFYRTHIVQQWSLGGDMHRQITRAGETKQLNSRIKECEAG